MFGIQSYSFGRRVRIGYWYPRVCNLVHYESIAYLFASAFRQVYNIPLIVISYWIYLDLPVSSPLSAYEGRRVTETEKGSNLRNTTQIGLKSITHKYKNCKVRGTARGKGVAVGWFQFPLNRKVD